MADLRGDRVGVTHGQCRGHAHAHFGVETMADPARSDIHHLVNRWDVTGRVPDGVHRPGLDPVHVSA